MDVDLTNGEPSTSTSTTTTSISKKINSGDHVLLRLADGGMRGVKVDKDAYCDTFFHGIYSMKADCL